MSKDRMSTKSSQQKASRTIVGVLSGIFLMLMAIIAQFYLEIDILNLEEEESSSDTAGQVDDTGDDGQDADQTDNDGGDSTDSVEDEQTVDSGGSTDTEGQWYDLYFTTPLNTDDRSLHTGSALEAQVVELINNADVSIDGALYELNLESVTQALIIARNRAVEVRLVLDDEDAVEDEESTVEDLEAAGWEIYCGDHQPATYDIRCDDRSALMHNKFLIIDGETVWMGSTNLTHNGVYNNNNNAFIITSPQLANNYQIAFDLMFEEGEFNQRGNVEIIPNRIVNMQTAAGPVQIETYFPPDEGDVLEARIVELVNNAQDSIYVLAFGIYLSDVGDAIIARHNDGVDVQVLIETTGSTRGQMPPMVCAGIAAKTDSNPDFLHHKVMIIDGEIAIIGSFNFSGSARDDNNENVLIIDSAAVAQQYIDEFNRLYNDPLAEVQTPETVGGCQ